MCVRTSCLCPVWLSECITALSCMLFKLKSEKVIWLDRLSLRHVSTWGGFVSVCFLSILSGSTTRSESEREENFSLTMTVTGFYLLLLSFFLFRVVEDGSIVFSSSLPTCCCHQIQDKRTFAKIYVESESLLSPANITHTRKLLRPVGAKQKATLKVLKEHDFKVGEDCPDVSSGAAGEVKH